MGNLAGVAMKADITEYMNMLSDSVVGELDYLAEQRNQQRLADMYRGHPFVQIPETVPELCRPRLLVTEFVDAPRFQTAVAERAQEERNRIGEIMYRFAFGSIMNGFFSGDPHPGNYLFPDGKVCFLDFGMVMDIAAPGRASIVAEIIAGALKDRQDMIDEGLRAIGFLPDDGPSGAEVWNEMRFVLAGPLDQDAIVRLDRDEFQRGMQVMMNPRSKLNEVSMKTERFEGWAAICMRYAIGSLAAISKFAPAANWRHIIAEIVLGEPAQTEIGLAWGSAPGGAEFAGSRWSA
jgi:predicted unusual protein kinase regulating ubiquinone biosynthesis (AarF/ABC1/UbiB family)